MPDLVAAYQLRDIDAYSQLLSPEFIFKFHLQDAQANETEFWTRDQDTTGTEALFGTPLVSQITITLTHGNAVPTNEVDLPPGTMTIRINQIQLEVDLTDGVTWLAQDIQNMFFRRGDGGAGEDATLWFLIEWRDIPTVGSPQPAVEGTTWGLLKTHYLEP